MLLLPMSPFQPIPLQTPELLSTSTTFQVAHLPTLTEINGLPFIELPSLFSTTILECHCNCRKPVLSFLTAPPSVQFSPELRYDSMFPVTTVYPSAAEISMPR